MILKKIYLIASVLITVLSFAQSPKLINYQGVARNVSGNPVINQTIGIAFKIHETSPTGTITFSEQQTIITNSLGLFSTQIGKNSPLTGVNWTNGPHFLEVLIDITGGTSFTSLGTQQMASVPFALYAEQAGNALPQGTRNAQTLRWDTISTSWKPDNNFTNDGNHTGIGLFPAGLRSRLHVTTNATQDTSVIFAFHPNMQAKGAALRAWAFGNTASVVAVPGSDPFASAIYGGNHFAYNSGTGLAVGLYGFGISNGTGVGNLAIGFAAANTATAVGLYATALGSPNAKKLAGVFDQGSVYFNDSVFIVGTNSVNANIGDVLTLSSTGRARWQTSGSSLWSVTSATSIAQSNLSGFVGIGTNSPSAKLDVNNTVGTTAIYAKTNATSSSTSPAIFGEAVGTSTNNAGVYGLSNNFSTGVKGFSGSFNGVWGESNGGTGVLGLSTQSGRAGMFLLQGNTSGYNAVYISTNSSPSALKSESFGSGPAIEAVHSNTSAGSSNTALLLKDGHLSAVGTNVNSSCFTTNSFSWPTISAVKSSGSNDVKGEVLAVFSPTAVIPSGGFVTVGVSYDKQYVNTPNVFIECLNQETASMSRYISGSSGSGFTVKFFNNTSVGISANALNFKYFVIE